MPNWPIKVGSVPPAAAVAAAASGLAPVAGFAAGVTGLAAAAGLVPLVAPSAAVCACANVTVPQSATLAIRDVSICRTADWFPHDCDWKMAQAASSRWIKREKPVLEGSYGPRGTFS